MSGDRQIVCVARTSFAAASAEGRFPPYGTVREGQLLLDSDPIVEATRVHWAPVGTADAATVRLIDALGAQATFRDLGPRLGPLPEAGVTSTAEIAGSAESPRAGPSLIATRAEVEAVRDRLADGGRPPRIQVDCKGGRLVGRHCEAATQRQLEHWHPIDMTTPAPRSVRGTDEKHLRPTPRRRRRPTP
jgi:hypothetical protein